MEERNEVRIAGRDLRIYLGECNLLFQKFDQIILSASEKHVETMRYIANILQALGVEVEKEFVSSKGKFIYKTEESYVTNEKTGRKELRIFHKLGLTKIPDLFMYTNPNKAIELKYLK